jgi:phosphoenolpyruvate phosphomutase
MKKKKIVYVPMGADIIHSGHLNILNHARKYGEIVIGLFTDSAIAEYKRLPLISYQQRYDIIKNIRGVMRVVPQETWDYSKNLNKIKPDFLVHGDDWKQGIQKKTREKVIKTLRKWSGKLIEPKYTKNISTTSIKNRINEIISLPENRVSRLKRLIYSKDIVRILESHNSLTGLIIDNLNIIKNKKNIEFDGMWSSSLTDSATKGKPDNSSVDFSSRITSLNEMMDVTSKPLVFDADNGGQIEHLPFLIRTLERSGVSAIIMEDKIGLKKNSLFKNQSGAKQDKPNDFAKKIKKITRHKKI